MRPTIIDLGGEGWGQPSLVGFVKSWIGARANAQDMFFSEMRKQAGGAPLLDAGVQFAEALARQHTEQARLVVDRLDRSRPRRRGERYRPQGPDEADGRSPEAHDAQPRGPALRVTIPYGTRAISVPLQLRNHRETEESITLSAAAPGASGMAPIPPELIRFRPDSLSIGPLSVGLVELGLRVDPEVFAPGEYWAEIVIEGADVKRLPLLLKISP